MGDLTLPHIPALGPAALTRVRQLEAVARALPASVKATIHTWHTLHAGLYARTIRIPSGVMITGVLIKIPTLLVIDGDALVDIGAAEPLRLSGYQVLPASAGRKQVIVALTDVHMTMLFPTQARTVEEAEREFTDEADILLSRQDPRLNTTAITEAP